MLSIAARDGCDVTYEMPIEDTIDETLARVEESDPDVAIFSVMTCQMPDAVRMANKLKDRRKDRIILAGGYHPSAMNVAESPFDAYIAGEGEIPFASVVNAIKEGRDWRKSPGLVFADDRTKPAERVFCLEDYPWALRSQRILRQKYFGLIYPPADQQTGLAFIEYGRGCIHKCIYCCKNVIWKNTLTYREAGDVVKEILALQHERNVNLFFFTDLNFTSNKDRVIKLCREMNERGFTGSWFCMSNIDTASPAVLEAMAQAGCVKVMFGIESVDNATLRLIHKGGTYANEKKIIETTLELGMLPHLFYMIGFPWETLDTIKTAMTSLQDLSGFQLRIGIATPLPGSTWFRQMQNRLTTNNWRQFDCEHLVFTHDYFSSAQLNRVVADVYDAFYKAPKYIERVEKFLTRWSHYKSSFTEFFCLLENSGYGPLARSKVCGES
jgi:radical SAM superfamily enzyme YgiQ (UPF0313 family)